MKDLEDIRFGIDLAVKVDGPRLFGLVLPLAKTLWPSPRFFPVGFLLIPTVASGVLASDLVTEFFFSLTEPLDGAEHFFDEL